MALVVTLIKNGTDDYQIIETFTGANGQSTIGTSRSFTAQELKDHFKRQWDDINNSIAGLVAQRDELLVRKQEIVDIKAQYAELND